MSGDVRIFIVGALGIVFLALGIFSTNEADWARVLQVFVGIFMIAVAVRNFRFSRRSG